MDPREIIPLSDPIDATVSVPGSKSLTNRVLPIAALARGSSWVDGILLADDTRAMIYGLRAVGIKVGVAGERASLVGCDGSLPATSARIDARLSGTTARFLAPLLTLGTGRFELDGAPPLRVRPMGPLLAALGDLGAKITELEQVDHLPVLIEATGWREEEVVVSGEASSQFLSGLLMAAPAAGDQTTIRLSTPVVSRPYVDLTLETMADFGADVDTPDDATFVVNPTGYQGRTYQIEPDASAASYLLAAPLITGGRVTVRGLTPGVRQGDAGFARVLERMGARVRIDSSGTTVESTGTLRGIDVDLSDMSDTAQTLAAVAVFADGPTRVSGIGFIRAKETDRIAAVVTELRRCGIDAEEHDDGFIVRPGTPKPATIQTYDDHRMAMSFALLGLRVPGIQIADPGCVDKTFPTYFEVLGSLRGEGNAG